MSRVPEKPTIDGVEARFVKQWEQDGVYRFDRTAKRADIFSIDTPPPTVSGSLHMGHVFSYTHTDTLARFWRMRGKSVFIRWDGMTTVCRPSAECKIFMVSRATRR